MFDSQHQDAEDEKWAEKQNRETRKKAKKKKNSTAKRLNGIEEEAKTNAKNASSVRQIRYYTLTQTDTHTHIDMQWMERNKVCAVRGTFIKSVHFLFFIFTLL